MKALFKKWMRKGFTIELPDIHTYNAARNFKMASAADILTAIDRYCVTNHHQVTYLRTDPTVFQLDGKDTYQAKLVLGQGRYQQGYCIQCTQVI